MDRNELIRKVRAELGDEGYDRLNAQVRDLVGSFLANCAGYDTRVVGNAALMVFLANAHIDDVNLRHVLDTIRASYHAPQTLELARILGEHVAPLGGVS